MIENDNDNDNKYINMKLIRRISDLPISIWPLHKERATHKKGALMQDNQRNSKAIISYRHLPTLGKPMINLPDLPSLRKSGNQLS